MEPLIPIPQKKDVVSQEMLQAEYGKPTLGKTVVKYLGYAGLILMGLAFLLWPLFIGAK